MLEYMSQPDRPSQETLTPEARRTMLRAFGDRMLVKLSAMDDPEDLPGVERAVRTAAAIERIYSRCDRAEGHAPDPDKLKAERARHKRDAVKARFELASTLEWNEKNRQRMGAWLDAAEQEIKAPETQTPVSAPAPAAPEAAPVVQPPAKPKAALTTTARASCTSSLAGCAGENRSSESIFPPLDRPASAAKADGGGVSGFQNPCEREEDASTSRTLPTSGEGSGDLTADKPRQASAGPAVTYIDMTDDIRAARRALGLGMSEIERAETPPGTGGHGPPG